jgi:hypothetical protein
VPPTQAPDFQFDHAIPFDPGAADAALAAVPARPGVFALFGQAAEAEPYLSRAGNLQRRIRRMLQPPAGAMKRLNLRDKVVRIEYSVTGSDFESLLTLYHASAAHFGHDNARKRMRLHTPFFVRFAMDNAYPRAYVTNRLSARALDSLFGPFPSRAAADRVLTETLNLFKLRRCSEELQPDPAHPGCVYSEMKMCLAPCFKGCSDERYQQEAQAVLEFFRTRGESMLGKLAAERDAASGLMEFEQAAALHTQAQKVKAIAQLVPEIVRPLEQLDAIIVQPAADSPEGEPCQDVALFAVRRGCIKPGGGRPALFSTLGMRHANENSGSTSLFAHPHMLAAVPLDEAGNPALTTPIETTEERLRRALAELAPPRAKGETVPRSEMASLSDHLSLLRRWYYRPAKQRVGEIFFCEPDATDGGMPVRRILRGVSRVCTGTQNVPPAEAAPAKISLDSPEGNTVD